VSERARARERERPAIKGLLRVTRDDAGARIIQLRLANLRVQFLQARGCKIFPVLILVVVNGIHAQKPPVRKHVCVRTHVHTHEHKHEHITLYLYTHVTVYVFRYSSNV